MKPRTVCIIHEAIGPYSAIAKIAAGDVRVALDAGWRVSVVTKFLEPALRDRVEWLPLRVPPRFFFLKWVTARGFIRRALGHRRFDVVHAHQPQVADLADVFSCHFLTRVAHERGCLEGRPGLRAAVIRLQQRGVLRVEDGFYRRWNPATRMLFNSELTRREFARLYGLPADSRVLVNACPPARFASTEDREAARRQLVGARPETVVGYLGGIDERKGYRRLIEALSGIDDAFLLMGGLYTDGLDVAELRGRNRCVGLVHDTDRFYAACDVVVMPSRFEPFGMVAFEAAARGVPVIASSDVGALPQLTEFGAGLEWRDGQPLDALLRRAVAERESFRLGAQRMAQTLSAEAYGAELLAVYADAADTNGRRRRRGARLGPLPAAGLGRGRHHRGG